MPVSVEQITLKLENGIAFIPPLGVGGNPPVHYRLEEGSSQTWFAHAAVPRAAMKASGLESTTIHFVVGLGNGKTVETKPIAFS